MRLVNTTSLVTILFSTVTFAASGGNNISDLNILLDGVEAFSFKKDGSELVDYGLWKKNANGDIITYESIAKTEKFYLSDPTPSSTPIQIIRQFKSGNRVVRIQGITNSKLHVPDENWVADLNQEKQITAITECSRVFHSVHCVSATKKICEKLQSFYKTAIAENIEKKLNECSNIELRLSQLTSGLDREVLSRQIDLLTKGNTMEGAPIPLDQLAHGENHSLSEKILAFSDLKKICDAVKFAEISTGSNSKTKSVKTVR